MRCRAVSNKPSEKTVAVVGTGTMGTGIAIVAARGGAKTIVFDVDGSRAHAAIEQMGRFLRRSVELGRTTNEAGVETLRRTAATSSIQDLAEADLIIEAVFEDIQTKADLFKSLDEVIRPDAIIASNTSTLSITQLASASRHPNRVVGLHFCLPAQLMKLVEVTPGLLTDDSVVQRAEDICTALGQIPVRTKDTPGFILNRFVIPINNHAIRLVEKGVALPDDIDRAIRGALRFPMGPLQLVDLVGLDTQLRLCEAFYSVTHDPRHDCPPLLRQMVAAGHLGKKSGQGFYRYTSTGTFGA
ncbi:3-hydroxyacyl-CoA dehydrogenase family protein [Caballeronia sp. GAWG2-1]|uniref:3-hydroxyacyl-CoA dehydrogenase family protein n=1 Tax=Caballeronia sp. GAWG2-1 TaxID=2921744 RepID=UPI0025424AC1|nr:3-hydroxyacyl-CoA dehydrogenase family protein [Caballeronia sp. GAWG2-1]